MCKDYKQRSSVLIITTIACMLQLTGCATTKSNQQQILVVDGPPLQSNDDQELTEEATDKDPYEDFNRAMYTFNGALDTYFAGPIISGYKWVAPDILQTGVSNVFANMKGIGVVLNDILQGKMQQGAEDTGRFLLNTTAGIGGLFDVADYVGLEQHDEDFGQTLAVWGVPKGPYLVLPILGPATFRGVPGAAVDTLVNPVTYLGWPVAVMAVIDKRATADESLKFIDEAAMDPYIFTRESYLQWRDFLASDGKVTANDDLYDEDFFMDDEEDLYLPDENKHIDAVDAKKPKQIKTEEKVIPNSIIKSGSAKSVVPEVKSADQKAFEKAFKRFNRAQQDYNKAAKELEILRTKGSRFKLNDG